MFLPKVAFTFCLNYIKRSIFLSKNSLRLCNKIYSLWVAQWFNDLEVMAMLSARNWVQVPLLTSDFFACNKVSPLINQTPTLISVSWVPINQLKAISGACKSLNRKRGSQALFLYAMFQTLWQISTQNITILHIIVVCLRKPEEEFKCNENLYLQAGSDEEDSGADIPKYSCWKKQTKKGVYQTLC